MRDSAPPHAEAVKDVARAVAFYTEQLGFTLDHQQLPAFASVSLGDAPLELFESAQWEPGQYADLSVETATAAMRESCCMRASIHHSAGILPCYSASVPAIVTASP